MTTPTATVAHPLAPSLLMTAPLAYTAAAVTRRPFTDVEARLATAVTGALDVIDQLRREAAWGQDQALEDLADRIETALATGRDRDTERQEP